MRKTIEQLRMRLNIMKMKYFKTTIEMKNKKYAPFIALVEGFKYDEDDTKVVFKRCEETIAFPNENEALENYTTYVKNIKSVNRYLPT